MDDPFTPEDIESLSAAIDAELRELGSPGTALTRGRTVKEALGGKTKTRNRRGYRTRGDKLSGAL